MVYFADEFDRYSHSRKDITMQMYVDLGFIPSHVTDIAPLQQRPGHDVVFNGREWVYQPLEVNNG